MARAAPKTITYRLRWRHLNGIRLPWLKLALVALLLALPQPARALSCLPPELDAEGIAAATTIVEARAGADRPATAAERKAANAVGISSFRIEPDGLRVAAFEVVRGWKGAQSGAALEVLFDNAWGDSFTAGQLYLIVSPKSVESLIWAPPCGVAIGPEQAEERGLLAALAEHFGSEGN